ncbi:MAG TPA: hypothetical protein VH137_04165 [Gemmatimonadales bacterium]|jgi:hypothetical protein|nr:hypothetical protein [Gemmatimonadales bacterium]
MDRTHFLSVLALAGFAVAPCASAQQPGAAPAAAPKCTAWDVKTMVGPKDSVVTTSVLAATPDGKGWTLKLAKGDPIPVRLIAAGGDSMVTEAGPFPSVLRPGQTVTTLHNVAHTKGNTMWGTMEAHYANGDVLKGKTEGTCKK